MPVDVGTTGDTDALATGAVLAGRGLLQPGGADGHDAVGDRHHGGDALLLHPQPELGDGAEPGAQRPAPDHRLGRARRPEPRHRRPGVLARRVPRHHHHGVLASTCRSTCSATCCRTPTSPDPRSGRRYRQQANFYALLQNQVQFAGDQNLAAGNVVRAEVERHERSTRSPTSWTPTGSSSRWRTSSEITGGISQARRGRRTSRAAAQSISWKQGTTQFVDGLVYPLQVGCQRRNTQAGALALK